MPVSSSVLHLGSSTCFVSFEDLPPVCLVAYWIPTGWKGDKCDLMPTLDTSKGSLCFNALTESSLGFTLFGLALNPKDLRPVSLEIWLATPLGIFQWVNTSQWFLMFLVIIFASARKTLRVIKLRSGSRVFILSMHSCHSWHVGFMSWQLRSSLAWKYIGIPWAQYGHPNVGASARSRTRWFHFHLTPNYRPRSLDAERSKFQRSSPLRLLSSRSSAWCAWAPWCSLSFARMIAWDRTQIEVTKSVLESRNAVEAEGEQETKQTNSHWKSAGKRSLHTNMALSMQMKFCWEVLTQRGIGANPTLWWKRWDSLNQWASSNDWSSEGDLLHPCIEVKKLGMKGNHQRLR